ncbi:hypothetical protein ACOZDF_28455 [Streptomyces griseoincarnatus]|nr:MULTISPECIES: hypothetical protein [Streptomyces]WPW17396.1 hypothetical protein UBV09_01170 [Streptomyces griseoincarnatus]
MEEEPTQGRRRVMLRRAAIAAQLVSVTLTIVRIVKEWLLLGA